MIPKITHRIWVQGDPPAQYDKWIGSWRKFMPDWEHILWSESSYREHLGPLTEIHDSTPYEERGAHYAQQADIAGKALLQKFGGVAMCADFECLRDMTAVFAGRQRVVAWWETPGQLSNGMIGAPPNHPAVNRAVDLIPESVRQQRERGNSINYGAGPKFIHKAWAGRDDIEVRPAGEVYPYLWMDAKPESYGDAYAVHHWTASWKD